MATIYGDNFQKAYVDVPKGLANMGEYGGVKKVLFDLKAGAVAADVLKIGKLPKGARILELKSVGAGTGAAFNLSAMDVMAAETDLSITIGTSPSATVYAWAEYVLD